MKEGEKSGETTLGLSSCADWGTRSRLEKGGKEFTGFEGRLKKGEENQKIGSGSDKALNSSGSDEPGEDCRRIRLCIEVVCGWVGVCGLVG